MITTCEKSKMVVGTHSLRTGQDVVWGKAVTKCEEGYDSKVAEVRRDDLRVFADPYGRGAGKLKKRKCLTRRDQASKAPCAVR